MGAGADAGGLAGGSTGAPPLKKAGERESVALASAAKERGKRAIFNPLLDATVNLKYFKLKLAPPP